MFRDTVPILIASHRDGIVTAQQPHEVEPTVLKLVAAYAIICQVDAGESLI